jgi:hypothetical protein
MAQEGGQLRGELRIIEDPDAASAQQFVIPSAKHAPGNVSVITMRS